MFDDVSPSKVMKVEPDSPIVLHGSSWDNDIHQEYSKVHSGQGQGSEDKYQKNNESCLAANEVLETDHERSQGDKDACQIL